MSPANTAKTPSMWPLIMAELKARPDFVKTCAEVILDGLKASVKHYSKEAKDWVATPDARARIDTLKLIVAYEEGMPLQRIIQAAIPPGGGVKDLEELARYIAETPELATAFERELKKARSANEKPAITAGRG